jgi:hypothetical protein
MIPQKPHPILRFLPQLRDILFFAIFLAALALGPRMLNMDGDLPRHLLTGRVIIETKSIPTTEPFVYPYEGRPYVSHEWLADVIFYLVHNTFGLAGIVLLAALLLATTFTAIYSYTSSRVDARLPVLVLVLWGAAVTSLNWVTRPHLISMCLLAIWLVWTDKAARGEKISPWIFFGTMILWSNLHGEFIAGMLVTLAYAAGWTMEFLFNRLETDLRTGARLWGVFLASGLASLLNPATYHPYTTFIGFVNNSYLMSRMSESNPPDFSRPEFLVLLGLLAISVLLLGLNTKRLSAGQAFLLTGFTAMSLMAARNVHLYGVVAPFVLAETVHGLTRPKGVRAIESVLKNVEGQVKSALWPVVTIIMFGALILGTKARNLYSFDPTFFPIEAVTWLESHPQEGSMFNDLNWGGYIALQVWPQQAPFVDSVADGTIEAKTQGELTKKYEAVITLSVPWQEILAQYNIEWVIVAPRSALAITLRDMYNWSTLYEDDTAIILRR